MYHNFCTSYDLCFTLPISVDNLSFFIAYLFEKGLSATSIMSLMSAISYYHKILPDYVEKYDPTKAFIIKQLLTGIKKQRPSLDSRQPLTLNIILSMIEKIHLLGLSFFENSLFKALFFFAFYFGLRVGEYTASPHNLMFNQISENDITVNFLSYKHAPLDHIPFSHKLKADSSMHCPVKLLVNYLSLRGHDNGPIFLLKNQPLSARLVALRLKQLLSLCNVNSDNNAPHSFRIGAACYWASLGLSHIQIRQLGRWQSNAFQKYIREVVHHPRKIPRRYGREGSSPCVIF